MTSEELFSRLNKCNKNQKRVLLLTHTDLDGAGAAVLTKLAFENAEVNVIHCPNNTMSSDILKAVRNNHNAAPEDKYSLILVTDISLNEKDAVFADSLIDGDFLLFDHHPTAEHLNQYNWACVYSGRIEDSSRAVYFSLHDDWHTSAAALLYDYLAFNEYYITLINPEVQKFAHKVSAYDTWDWKTTKCDTSDIAELNSLCYLYGLDRFEDIICQRLCRSETIISSDDNMLLQIEKEKVDVYLNKIKNAIVTGCIEFDNRVYSYAGCISTTYVAQVFEYLRDHYSDCQLFVINTGSSISLRSDVKDIDLQGIVKALGGGGHKSAAGFPLCTRDINSILELPFKNIGSNQTSVFI